MKHPNKAYTSNNSVFILLQMVKCITNDLRLLVVACISHVATGWWELKGIRIP